MANRGMWFLQPLFGGFFRIAPLAHRYRDGVFYGEDGMEETKTAACHARRCLQY